jgi:hypothetical protein
VPALDTGAAAVMAMVAVDPLGVNEIPLGSTEAVQPLKLASVMELTGGSPLVVTVKLPAVPIVNVVLFALVIAGALLMVRVKAWVAGVPTPFEALRHSVYVPASDAGAAAVMAMAAVVPLGVNETPEGNVVGTHVPKAALVMEVTAGVPLVVTVKLLAVPVVKVVLAPLVIDGGPLMVRTNVWVAGVPTPFEAFRHKVSIPELEAGAAAVMAMVAVVPEV